MSQVIVNPVTRISGMMEMTAQVENNLVVDAQTEGLMFRGFELMLRGRPPLDAVYFTQRICGICSAAHATASSLALEAALGVVPIEQGRYLRDLTHACDFIQNHIRHFYQLSVPDYVRLPDHGPVFEAAGSDFRIPQPINDSIAEHYFTSLPVSRSAHTMLAVLGGKAPHSHGIYIGGTTSPATVDAILALRSLLREITTFVDEIMLPDTYAIAQYYGDYFYIGGGHGNLLTYGCFNNYLDIPPLYVNPGVYIHGELQAFDPNGITESTQHAYYAAPPETYTPFETVVEPQPNKPDADSWIKAPRYFGIPCEGGPLARMWITGEYRNGVSVMDRMIARTLETKKILGIMNTLLDLIVLDVDYQKQYVVPEAARGMGLTDTSRGALGHWLEIAGKKIELYQIITPSAWNLSSSANSVKGTAEQALLGTYVANLENPVELGRVIRSFDPCVSCATHVFTPAGRIGTWKVVP